MLYLLPLQRNKSHIQYQSAFLKFADATVTNSYRWETQAEAMVNWCSPYTWLSQVAELIHKIDLRVLLIREEQQDLTELNFLITCTGKKLFRM